MTTAFKDQILACISQYQIPYLNRDPQSAGVIKNLTITEKHIEMDIELGFPLEPISLLQIKDELLETLSPCIIGYTINLTCSWKIVPKMVQPGLKTHPAIKNIIAIGSAKGGVGKSTTALNLALAMAADNVRVGLLDADIFGPNQPLMLGVKTKPEVVENKKLKPLMCYGLQTMSIGYLVDDQLPVIWRGPMVSSALQQLINETQWDALDYLIIYLPPGTGDIQLTLAQKIPLAGSVVITTPQDVAVLDAQKGIEMFKKVNVEVLGLIENMSSYHCPNCNHQSELFGKEGGKNLAERVNIPLLGQIPLSIEIRKAADEGKPIFLSQPQSKNYYFYQQAARRMLAELSQKKKNSSAKLPKIVVE